MAEFLQPLLDWITQNPHWAGFAVGLVSLSESILVIGLLIPGAVIMFGVGALVATGTMDLLPTLAWAAAGALIGDTFSFWLGRHFHQRLRVIWPFRRYPRLLARGVDFFYRHGGKSVLLARFVGPLRPVIPAVAGMLDMPVRRFLPVAVLGAVTWAPAYILPGMLFGASLGMAAEVAGRLAVLLVMLVTVVWLSVWLVHRLILILQPRASRLMDRILEWSRNHPLVRPMAGALLDPGQPEIRGLAALALLLALASFLFLLAFQQVVAGSLLTNIDHYLFFTLQELRNPLADQALVLITQLGDGLLLVLVTAGVCTWLAWRRQWTATLHMLAALGVTFALTRALKLVTRTDRPIDLYQGADAFAFPSAHASLSVVVYGFMAVLAARELAPARRWWAYSFATLLVTLIGFSRLYLGAHWLSDVLGGISLGLVWLALMGIAYRRHLHGSQPSGHLFIVSILAICLAAGVQFSRNYQSDMERYAWRPQTGVLAFQDWLSGDWRTLPAWRLDLADQHNHPLDLQLAGPMEFWQHEFSGRGWQTSESSRTFALLSWLAPDPDPADVILMPQVHNSHQQRLLLKLPVAGRILVLRLWPADRVFKDSGLPLWVGNVSFLDMRRDLPLLTLPVTGPDFDTPLDYFVARIRDLPHRLEVREPLKPATSAIRWDGRTLLIWPADITPVPVLPGG